MQNNIKLIGKYNNLINDISNLPRGGFYLYVLSFKDKIKIGKTGQIHRRFKAYKEKIDDIAVIGPISYHNFMLQERILIRQIINSKNFLLLKGYEWFLGNFNDAIKVANELDFVTADNLEQQKREIRMSKVKNDLIQKKFIDYSEYF